MKGNNDPSPAQDARPFHASGVEEVFRRLEGGEKGLTTAEARARLERYGPNRLTEVRRRGPLARFLLQFHNVLIYILLAAAGVTALLQHWVDTAVILGVVVINAVVGFIQEGKAERAMEAIRRMLSLKAAVLRDGHQVTVPAEDLVPGDVVFVQSGDRVPADLRLFRVKNLQIDEASLTGESVPVEKNTEPVAADTPLGDRLCMAYSGTLVTYGQGSGVAVATGDATELGRISEMLAAVERIETPLLRKLKVFGRWLSVAIVAVAAATFAFGVLIQGYGATDMFMAAVGLAVAAIPEGLPAIITITLAIGVQRMARRNAIIRVLPAVETLGSVTVICSDKTGTLTRNEMTVQSMATGEHVYRVSGVGYEPHGEFLLDDRAVDPNGHPDLLELLRAALLCNDARLRHHDGRWTIDGDPTEGALVVAAHKAGLEARLEAERRPRTDVIPFESEHRFMATLHHDHAGHGFVYLKGAPERVLEMCTHERVAGEDRPIRRAAWQRRVDELAAQGERVLAVAFRPAEPGGRELRFEDVEEGLTLLGLVGMVDPPREEAIRAVTTCHEAGIVVKMITGDHAVTARAIAADLGIGDDGRVLTGAELERLGEEELRATVEEVNVYARVSPEHKLRLVQALQANGEVVAMTGDGVNDAPALKRADVGVAMGVKGTEAAKEAAEIVLADDNFASIEHAVEEGRTVYDNLKKALIFILPTNGGQAFVIVAAVVAGMVLPITPVQILWVNMVTAVTLALSLAFEPTEADVMRRPPRDPREPILSRFLLWRVAFVSLLLLVATFGLFLYEDLVGAPIEAARTVAVNTLVACQVFYLFSSRYLYAPAYTRAGILGNPYVLLAVGAIVLLQLGFTYAPPMQVLFGTADIDAATWGKILAAAAAVFVLVELEKALLRRLMPARQGAAAPAAAAPPRVRGN
jgi:magnesium-transporting ATPase (P-type)